MFKLFKKEEVKTNQEKVVRAEVFEYIICKHKKLNLEYRLKLERYKHESDGMASFLTLVEQHKLFVFEGEIKIVYPIFGWTIEWYSDETYEKLTQINDFSNLKIVKEYIVQE